MAKSLRSKWRRKMRAIKRERYGEKELKRLKKMLGIDDTTTDINMTDNTVIESSCDNPEGEKTKEGEPSTSTEQLPMYDVEQEKKQDDKWTMKLMNEFGAYPIWLHHRKVKAVAKQRKKMKHARNKKVGKKKL